MPAGDGKKLTHSILKTCGVFFPGQVMQVDPDHIEANAFGPAQFLVDCGGIEAVSLPAFQLIDGRIWNVVATHQPALLFIPGIGFFSRPDGL